MVALSRRTGDGRGVSEDTPNPVASDLSSVAGEPRRLVDVREILSPRSPGQGYSEGVEFFVEKRLTSKLYGQSNLSFSRTRHAGLDGCSGPAV